MYRFSPVNFDMHYSSLMLSFCCIHRIKRTPYLTNLLSLLIRLFSDCTTLSTIKLWPYLSLILRVTAACDHCLYVKELFIAEDRRNSEWLMGLLILRFRHWVLINGCPSVKSLALEGLFPFCIPSNSADKPRYNPV